MLFWTYVPCNYILVIKKLMQFYIALNLDVHELHVKFFEIMFDLGEFYDLGNKNARSM